jgi:hypothetical protein
MKSRFFRDRLACRADVGACEVHRVAVGQDTGAPDVDQHASLLRRRARDGNRVGNVIGALAARIDPSRHPVMQDELRSLSISTDVRVNVEQTGDDELAARVDHVGGISRDAGSDCGDASARDRHVADRIEARGGIDDATTFDNQVVTACLGRT